MTNAPTRSGLSDARVMHWLVTQIEEWARNAGRG